MIKVKQSINGNATNSSSVIVVNFHFVMAPHVRLQFLISSFIIIVSFAKYAFADTRKLSIAFNENCTIPECSSSQADEHANLIHVKAEGSNDTLHYLWSSIGAPTMLIARTTLAAQLIIEWNDLVPHTKPGSISFSPEDSVLHASALMFTRLIQYNDSDDLGVLKSKDARILTPLDNLKWQNSKGTINHRDHSAVLNTTMGTFGDNSSISFYLRAFGNTSRLKTLPHLQHTENSTQLDLTMLNLATCYMNSRFGLEMLVIGSNASSKVNLHEDVSIDDEYTPATFSMLEVKLPDFPKGSYLQWKPVSYTKTDRVMKNARHVYQYHLDTDKDKVYVPKTGIAFAFHPLEGMPQVGALNITFGITDDGFYTASKYISWSLAIGYGDPPEDYMTLTVYIIISAGLGIPILLVVFGGAGVCFSKHRQKKRRQALSS